MIGAEPMIRSVSVITRSTIRPLSCLVVDTNGSVRGLRAALPDVVARQYHHFWGSRSQARRARLPLAASSTRVPPPERKTANRRRTGPPEAIHPPAVWRALRPLMAPPMGARTKYPARAARSTRAVGLGLALPQTGEGRPRSARSLRAGQTRPSRTRPTCSWSSTARSFLSSGGHQSSIARSSASLSSMSSASNFVSALQACSSFAAVTSSPAVARHPCRYRQHGVSARTGAGCFDRGGFLDRSSRVGRVASPPSRSPGSRAVRGSGVTCVRP